MIRNSLYNSYLPEAQKGGKIKQGVYDIPIIGKAYLYYYDGNNWYRKRKEGDYQEWEEMPKAGGLVDGKRGLNYYASVKNKEGISPYLLEESIPEDFKPIENKGLTATDLGETKKPITENVLRNPIVYSPSLDENDNEVYISPEGTVVPLSNLTYGINSIIPSRNTLLVDTPITTEEQPLVVSPTVVTTPTESIVSTGVNALKEKGYKVIPSDTYVDIDNRTIYKKDNKWYDLDSNKELTDPDDIKIIDAKLKEKENLGKLIIPTKEEIIADKILSDLNKMRPDNLVRSNLFMKPKTQEEIIVEETPTPKDKKRRGFDFPDIDLSGLFTRRKKDKVQQPSPAEIEEIVSDDIYNPNNFAKLDVIKGKDVYRVPSSDTELPSNNVQPYAGMENVYMPESARLVMQGKYPKLEEPIVDNIPVRIVERQINQTAPGGMGLLPFVSRSRTINNMKNQTRKAQYGGELTDEDFDYTMDIDTDKLVQYIKGGYLPKAQTSLNLNNPPTLGDYLGFTYPSANINFNPDFNYKRKQPTDYFGLDKKVNTLKAQPYQYPYTELYKNVPYSPWSEKELLEEGFLQKDDKGKISQGKPIEFNTMDTTPLTGDKQFGTKPNERIQYKDVYNYEFDPRKIYERANQEQYAASFGPFAYNLGQFLSKAKSVPTQYTQTPIIQYSVTPDYTPFVEQEAKIRQAINEQSGLSAAQRLNTLIGAGIGTAKGKALLSRQNVIDNIKARQEADKERKQQQLMIDTALQQSRLSQQAAEAVREAFGTKAVEQGERIMKSHGQLLAKEKEARKKLESANLLAKDYQWEPVADKFGNIDYKIKHIPSNAYLTPEQYKEHLDSVQKKTKEEEDKKAEEKTASTEQSITEKKIQEAKDLERKRLESEPEYLKYQEWLKSTQNKTEEKKKYGGWIKENQQHKKRRNRLYY